MGEGPLAGSDARAERAGAAAPDRGVATPLPPVSPSVRLLVGGSPPVLGLSLLLAAACVMLLPAAQQAAASPQYAFSFGGAIDGIVSQLSVTGPAAILIALATALNLLAGAVTLRLAGVEPYRSAVDAALGGFVGAVLLDAAALFLLGGLGFFGPVELFVVQLLPIALFAAGRGRPLLAAPIRLRGGVPAIWWLFVVALWLGPVLLQLASPVVPYMDVLPNHVAPVEHARAFGSFATLTTSPSPIYGPSRIFLGYVGLLGTLSTMTGLAAGLAVAAFTLPLTVLTAGAIHGLAARLFGPLAAFWALVAFPLTFTFMRLADDRATAVVFPLAAWALTRMADGRMRRARIPDVGLGAAIGAAILMHPVVGAVLAATAALLVFVEPERFAGRVVPALGIGAGLALPQAATMIGLDLPAYAGLLGFPVATALGLGLAAVVDRYDLEWRLLGTVLLAVGLIGLLYFARTAIPAIVTASSDLVGSFPLLSVTAAAAALVGRRRLTTGWRIALAGILAGLAFGAATQLVPAASLLEQSIRYEVPKSLGYWTPVLLAVVAGATLAAVWRRRELGSLRHAIVAAFLVTAVFPLAQPFVDPVAISEHRAGEALAIDLREAERGYWVGYADPRQIVDGPETQVLNVLRAEIAAGRLTASTKVLHFAASFQQWSSIPIGVFTGALETDVSNDPEHSIHTIGGRLNGFDQADTLLSSGYGYVVLEPNQVRSDLPARIEAAGYRPIFTNARATVYVRG